MTFFLIEVGKIARNTLKHNSDYINHISSLLDSCNRIHAHMEHTFALFFEAFSVH